MEKRDEQIETNQDLSQLWIKNNVYDSLEKIEQHERYMRTGFESILEFVGKINIPKEIITEIQLTNMQLLLVEMDILIENVASLLKPKEYKKLREKVDILLKIHDEGVGEVKLYKNIKNEVNKTHVKKLTEVFFVIQDRLIKLRSEMVKNLSHLLFLSKDKGRDI